ncbi:hypothetical protein V8C86DRAFT_2515999 [Haematococcus lacustris]
MWGQHVRRYGSRCSATLTGHPAPTIAAPPPPQTARPKVSLVALGCPKNTVDGEVLLGDLQRTGFDITTDHSDADAVLVNTCAFVEDAKAESLEAIMAAAALNADGKQRRIVVTGCLAQRYAEQLAADLPEANLVVGFERYGSLASSLRSHMGLPALPDQPASPLPTTSAQPSPSQPASPTSLDASSSSSGSSGTSAATAVSTSGPGQQQGGRVQVGSATVPFRPEWDRVRLTPRHSAYLRVAEGCNHACTFCAIPGFRGKFRSKPWDALLAEARHLVAGGAVELNLIAEDTNQYGMDKRDGRGLAHLLRELGQLEGLRWIRILYAYPSYFTQELVEEIASNPKVCKYIDMPLQHISNLVLLAMNRPPQDHTLALLGRLRDSIPHLALRTTFINGFPGETDEQHRELVNFCKTFKFERMGSFAYSEEDGTPAATYPTQTPAKVRERRRDELTSLQQRVGEQWAARLVGQEVDVLVDGYNDDGWLIGRTQWDAPDVDPIVFLSEPSDPGVPPLEVGQIRRCLVDSNSLFDLEAHPIA